MAQPPSDLKFIQASDGIREYEMASNGLRVLVMEDHSAPVATVMLTYLVGSRHETDQFRGGAHLLEHMMFKGTPDYQKAKGTAIARLLQRTGAHLNASTWKDGTNYYESLPSDQLDLALDIEADRMRNSLMRGEDLKSEMPVVQSEFDRLENSPIIALDLALWSEAFKKHTYHFPIIGIREDLEKMPIESLKLFYDRYYWPNNAVLAVIGDFETDALLEKIAEKFSPIPAAPEPIHKTLEPEPEQSKPRAVKVKREDHMEAVMIGHKIPGAVHEDTATLDVLAAVLSYGKLSRLYRGLNERNLAVEVHTDNSKSHDPGMFATEAVLTPHARHEDVEKIILETYRAIQRDGISEAELRRAKNQLRAQVAYSRDGSYSLAGQLSRAIASGDWRLVTRYLKELDAVTAEKVRRAALTYLIEERMTRGYLISKNKTIAGEKKPAPDTSAAPASEEQGEITSEEAAETARAPHAGAAPFASRIRKSEIHGIQLRSIVTGVEDVVTIMGSLEGAGQAFGPNPVIAQLTVALLDEGTTKRKKFEIARLLEDRGAAISFQIDNERVGFHARCLRKDVALVMELIAEQLRFPAFDPQEFGRQKDQQRVLIEQDKNNTALQAQGNLSRILYEPSHPNHESSFEDQLKNLEATTLEDVRLFHQNNIAPRNMRIVAAGDVDSGVFEKAVETYFDNWAPGLEPAVLKRQVIPQAEGKTQRVYLPDKVKVDALFGHALPLSRRHPDYLAVYLGNAVLGGDFSARLTSTVRDEQGLTYSVHSELHGIDRKTEGDWQISIILNAKVLEQGIEATRAQILKFAAEGITQQELEDKQQTLIGRFKVSLSTTSGLAHRILRFEELGLGVEYLDTYPEQIAALTLDQVNAAVRRYFHPEQLHVIVSGTVGESESQASAV